MTGAAAAIALLALSAAPASGGFRYVPPEAEFTRAEEVGGSTGAAETTPPPDPGPAVPGTNVWRVHEGEMLRAVLARWAGRAGMDAVFLTDRRYRLDGDAAFGGGFADAVQALFQRLSHLPHAPVATRSEGATALVVRHRAPRVEEEEDGR